MRISDWSSDVCSSDLMDVDWIDIHADEDAIRAKLLDTPHTRLPVGRGTVEDIIGVVQARDIMTALFRGEGLNLETLMRKVEVVPDQVDAMDALEEIGRATCRERVCQNV